MSSHAGEIFQAWEREVGMSHPPPLKKVVIKTLTLADHLRRQLSPSLPEACLKPA